MSIADRLLIALISDDAGKESVSAEAWSMRLKEIHATQEDLAEALGQLDRLRVNIRTIMDHEAETDESYLCSNRDCRLPKHRCFGQAH